MEVVARSDYCESSALSTVSFLIVDQLGHIASLQIALLKAYGVQKVTHLRKPEDVLPTMKANAPDLLIINWLSSSESWIELMRSVRDEIHSPDPFIHVMLASSSPSHSRIKAAIAMGVDTIVTIPLRGDTFYGHLRRIVESPRTFVRTGVYFGPDRRRRKSSVVLSERRGQAAARAISIVKPEDVENWRIAQRTIARDL